MRRLWRHKVLVYSNKHVTTGEGGMILTDQDWIKERSMSYRNLCFQKENALFMKR